MVYAVDFGNTNVKVASFEMGELLRIDSYDIQNEEQWQTELKKLSSDKLILSSSSLDERKVVELCGLQDAFIINEFTHYPIRFTYNRFRTLGRDRVAGSVGAFSLVKKENALLIDAGTCVTYDVVEKSGVHLGGMISPGLKMRLRSMHEMTANLPLVKKEGSFYEIASSTEGALRSGGKYGIILEIQGYIKRMKQRFGNFNVYLTGGDAGFIKEFLQESVILEKHITLYGLYEILKWNDKEV